MPAASNTCAIATGYTNVAAATYQVVGVFNGVNYTNSQGIVQPPQPFWPANTATYNNSYPVITVNDLPYCVFQIQTNGTLGANFNAALSTFTNYAFAVGAPNPATGQSTFALDVAGTGDKTLVINPMKIVGLADPTIGSTNSWTDAFVDVLVIFNNHVYKPGTLGIA